MDILKVCTDCKTAKYFSDFSDGRITEGDYSICNKCRVIARQKAETEKNAARYRANNPSGPYQKPKQGLKPHEKDALESLLFIFFGPIMILITMLIICIF